MTAHRLAVMLILSFAVGNLITRELCCVFQLLDTSIVAFVLIVFGKLVTSALPALFLPEKD